MGYSEKKYFYALPILLIILGSGAALASGYTGGQSHGILYTDLISGKSSSNVLVNDPLTISSTGSVAPLLKVADSVGSGVEAGIYVGLLAGPYMTSGGSVGTTTPNEFRIFTSNTDRITVSESGLVGINAVVPLSTLFVNGSSIFRATVQGTQTFKFQNKTGFTIMDIDTANNRVGIGTTAPDSQLTIQGATANGEWLSLKDNAGTTRWHINYMDGTGLNFAQTGVADGRIFIANSGKVGIGTVFPAQMLDVAGAVQMTGFVMPAGASSGYVLTSNMAGVGTWQPPAGGLGGSGTGNYVTKFTGPTTVGNSVIYESAGNIGIGTTSPSGRLEVIDSIVARQSGAPNPPGGWPAYSVLRASSNSDAISGGWSIDAYNSNPTGFAGRFQGSVDIRGQSGNGINPYFQYGTLSVYNTNGGGGGTSIYAEGNTAIYAAGTVRVTGNVGIGTTTPPTPLAKLVVANGVTGEDGGSGDGIAVFVNSPSGAALNVSQGSISGLAGFFNGKVEVGGSITLNNVNKAAWQIKVCGINGGACLGQYLYTVVTSPNPPYNVAYYYNDANNNIASTGNIFQTTYYCPDGYGNPVDRSTGGVSWYDTSSCTAGSAEYTLNVPYGTGKACIQSSGIYETHFYKRYSGGCVLQSQTKTFHYVIDAPNVIRPVYEFR